MKELFVALIIVLVGGRLRVWGITGWTYEPTTSSCKGKKQIRVDHLISNNLYHE